MYSQPNYSSPVEETNETTKGIIRYVTKVIYLHTQNIETVIIELYTTQ
jgi:hypothetical protein